MPDTTAFADDDDLRAAMVSQKGTVDQALCRGRDALRDRVKTLCVLADQVAEVDAHLRALDALGDTTAVDLAHEVLAQIPGHEARTEHVRELSAATGGVAELLAEQVVKIERSVDDLAAMPWPQIAV